VTVESIVHYHMHNVCITTNQWNTKSNLNCTLLLISMH